jgi:trigger factor
MVRSVMADVVQNAVNEANRKIVDENNLKLAMEPQIQFPESKDEVEQAMVAKSDLAFTSPGRCSPPSSSRTSRTSP